MANVMPVGLDHLNASWQEQSLAARNDCRRRAWYHARMAAPRHDWYLREWLKSLGKRQADISRDLEWNKARVSPMVRGEQQYTRDAVNEVSAYLNLRPYELLMHPDEAMRLRRLREDAIRIAHDNEAPDDELAGKKVSLG